MNIKYFLSFLFLPFMVYADNGSGTSGLGKPDPWQLGLQKAASPVMESISGFHNGILLWTAVLISVFVLILLALVIFKFNSKANPVPSKTSHNTMLEIIWTAVPVLILIVIVVPSIKNLSLIKQIPDYDMTVKVVGRQWYWQYEYPDHDNIGFDSYLKAEQDLLPGEPYLLATDNKVVLPVGKNIRFLITGGDVIHSFAIPALGIKTDAVPGRINETWTNIKKAGTYYGQCSELCGTNHGFMPITIEAVSEEEFNNWLVDAKEEFAYNPQQKFVTG